MCVLVTRTCDSQGEHGEVGREKSAWLETWGGGEWFRVQGLFRTNLISLFIFCFDVKFQISRFSQNKTKLQLITICTLALKHFGSTYYISNGFPMFDFSCGIKVYKLGYCRAGPRHPPQQVAQSCSALVKVGASRALGGFHT